ncbi:MAG: ATP-binding protein [Methanothrix sp.]|jgi:PAS domain S-box-containing protein|nr:ATP-binding protein [Methanothrix sp.]
MSFDIPRCRGEVDLHRTLIERSAEGFLVLRGECIIYANSAACKILGCTTDEIINGSVKNIISLGSQEDVCIDNFSENGEFQPIKLHFLRKDGSNVWIRATRSMINYQGTDALLVAFSDITEEERSRQLIGKERLATIGETAVMIGHDLRNPMQAIMNTTYLVRLKVEESLAEANLDTLGILADLAAIEKQLLYMNKIVCNLRDYSRPLNPDMVDLSLPTIISDTLASMNIPDNIEIRTEIEENITLRGDPTMINHVLINIISNAIQAMPEGGMLGLSASSTEKDVILAIKDTGPGIPLEVKYKIYQPLITTKAKGMGMGLAVCKRLLEAMDGDIRIVSEKCRGTVAEIKMPLAMGR